MNQRKRCICAWSQLSLLFFFPRCGNKILHTGIWRQLHTMNSRGMQTYTVSALFHNSILTTICINVPSRALCRTHFSDNHWGKKFQEHAFLQPKTLCLRKQGQGCRFASGKVASNSVWDADVLEVQARVVSRMGITSFTCSQLVTRWRFCCQANQGNPGIQ